MKYSKVDILAGSVVLISVGLMILDAMPKLTTLIYSMVV